MKLYTMKCVYDPDLLPEEGGGMLGQKEYFVKLETVDEEEAYYETMGGMMCSSKAKAWWDGYMCHALQDDLDEDSIYYYIRVKEPEVTVGDQYTDADGLVWERVE